MEILRQLGDLFLAAIPTAVIVFLFYLFLRWSFFGPIERVVLERGKRIEGAWHEAEELRRNAKEKTRAYQEALRKARGELFREQEGLRRTALDERGVALQQARQNASEEMLHAKRRIQAEIEAARAELETSSTQLAEEIARAILEPQRQVRPRPAGEVR
jgi:F0F1-type ATP synthase membrane subunit b/b'